MPFVAVAVELGLIALDFVYHRYIADQPTPPQPGVPIIPALAVGSPYPLVWGKTRVKSPVLAWYGSPGSVGPSPTDTAFVGPNITFVYTLDLFFAIGIGFENGGNRLHAMWAGDVKLTNFGSLTNLTDLNGTGDFENWNHGLNPPRITTRSNALPSQVLSEGVIEFLNGNAAQVIVDPVSHAARTDLGRYMLAEGVTPGHIPGYRGFIGAFLYYLTLKSDGAGGWILDDGSGSSVGSTVFQKYQHWWTGIDPQLATYSFEVSSYPSSALAVQPGMEANIVDVLFDVLCGILGKLGLPSSIIDTTSFAAAGVTLYIEGNGYSRSLEEQMTARDLVTELCSQADGILYEDPTDGKIHFKLVRADYDPNAVTEITVDNAEDIADLRVTSWTGVPNKIRLTYRDRDLDYKDNSIAAQNQANAVGQNGDIIERAVSFPGCCTSANAAQLANRELAATSRPITQCSAIVGRQFYNTVPGDVVAITWPDFGWYRVLFRVAAVSRGTLADGRIKLSLIQEYFNVSRGVVSKPGIGAFQPTKVGGVGV